MKEEEMDQCFRSEKFFAVHHEWVYGGEWEEIQSEKSDRLREKLRAYPEWLIWVDWESWPNDSNEVEIALGVINKKTLKIFYDFLCNESSTCIVMVILDSLIKGNYMGRIVFKTDVITVEDKLSSWWVSTFGGNGLELDS
jgi:hypothetical protein